MEQSDQKFFKALPVQVIEIENGVILKRGCTEFRISGQGAAEAVYQILAVAENQPITIQQLCENFSELKRPIIKNLIEQLIQRRIMTSPNDRIEKPNGFESHLDIFYWHFGDTDIISKKKLNDLKLVILGVNHISRQLSSALFKSGITNIQVVDFPLLRNLRLFDEFGQIVMENWNFGNISPLEYSKWVELQKHQEITCIVATSDFGNHEILRFWNSFCLSAKYHFLPVVLQNTIGYLGPLTIPRETACFECLRARQDANFTDPQLRRATESKAFEGQAIIGFLPSMASILGDIAAVELIKFYSGILPGQNVGALIEVNLLATFLTVRRILKNPRCAACSQLMIRSPLQARQDNANFMDGKNL